MDLGLNNKRVIVTGGTKSIGRAVADEGAHVAICARNAEEVTTGGFVR
jgi:3-oxoacyl-[acyl-carrier protein] reductase